MTTARLFVAVDPPPPVQNELARWARWALEPGEASTGRARPGRTPTEGIRRVDARSLHVTVCFLGDQPLDLVDEITDVLHEGVNRLVLAGMPVGPLGVGAPVWLPPRRPRALALEIHAASGRLAALYDDLRVGLGTTIGWEPERRRFRPHITVARLSSWAPPPACTEPTPPLVFEPVSLTVYRSRLQPDGADYQALGRIRLDGNPTLVDG